MSLGAETGLITAAVTAPASRVRVGDVGRGGGGFSPCGQGAWAGRDQLCGLPVPSSTLLFRTSLSAPKGGHSVRV